MQNGKIFASTDAVALRICYENIVKKKRAIHKILQYFSRQLSW